MIVASTLAIIWRYMPAFYWPYTILFIAILIGGVLGLVAYLTLAERKISAWIQDRIGPNRVGPFGLLQPLVDGGKFFLKEDVIPKHVDKVFFLLAPAAAICTSLLGIPSEIGRESGDAAEEPSVGVEGGPLPDQLAPEAGRDADAAMLPDTTPSCDLRKEFDPPTLLASVSTAGLEGSPKLSDDEMTIYFDALRSPEPTWDLYTAKRTSLTDSFGTPVLLGTGVNTADMQEFAPNVSPDGLSIFFERQDPNTFVDNFWVATRTKTTDPFGTAAPISGVNLPEYQGKLDVRGDGADLFFVKKGTGTTYHLWEAQRMAGGSYVLNNLTSLNSTGTSEEYGSAVSKDGLVLYFGSTRTAGTGGRTGNDIWVATRASITDPFGLPTLVGNVNSVKDDEPTWLSNDGCRLYLQSDRAGGAGMQDIYVAARPK